MREIKFRAWDKYYNIMNPCDDHMWSDEFITSDGRVLEMRETHGYGGTDTTFDDISDERILMQYTGLTDKHGKEIYEGDILRNSGMWTLHSTVRFQHNREAYGEGEKFIVHKGIAGYELRHTEDWNSETDKNFVPNGCRVKPYVDNFDFWNLHKTLEVIGNIYENPELLKEATQ